MDKDRSLSYLTEEFVTREEKEQIEKEHYMRTVELLNALFDSILTYLVDPDPESMDEAEKFIEDNREDILTLIQRLPERYEKQVYDLYMQAEYLLYHDERWGFNHLFDKMKEIRDDIFYH